MREPFHPIRGAVLNGTRHGQDVSHSGPERLRSFDLSNKKVLSIFKCEKVKTRVKTSPDSD